MSAIAKEKGYGLWMKGKEGSQHQRVIASTLWKASLNPRWKGGVSRAETHRNWNRAHKDRVSLYHKLRKARSKGAAGSFTFQEWLDLKRRFNFTCPSCLESEPTIKLTADHIIPISKGGSNYITNIQPLCARCNGIKYTKIQKFDPPKVSDFAIANV